MVFTVSQFEKQKYILIPILFDFPMLSQMQK